MLRAPERDKRRCSPCARSTHRAPPACAPVLREGDLLGDLNTVGRVTGALLRLRQEKTTHPQPLPVKEGAVPTPAARGRSEEVHTEGGPQEQCTGQSSAAFSQWTKGARMKQVSHT